MFTSKGFAPVRTERDVDQLAVEGDWPGQLTGTLYRIGPNPQFDPIEPYNPLLGDGMVHAFRIENGRVAYRNRWVRTQQWMLEHDAGRALFATSGDPRASDPSVAGMRTDGVANTNLVSHGNRLLALEEGHAPIELDPVTLATRGVWNFDGRLPANMTAHPKLDPVTGEMAFFANEPRRRFDGEITWYVADRTGELTHTGAIRAPFASVVHDFAVTEDYLVFIVCPVTISMSRARAGGPALAWDPEHAVHVAVVSRRAKEAVRWFTVPPRFVWHVANAWNEGGVITIDVCEQAAPAFPFANGAITPSEDWRQYLAQWRLSVETGDAVRITRLCDPVCEYPRIDDRFAMRPTRHCYVACHGGPGTEDMFHRGVGHFEVATGVMTTYRFGATVAASEPVFVPASGQAAEGRGFVLCVVYDEGSDRSRLALFDAAKIERGPIAHASVPFRVPMGFHGVWVGRDA